MPTAAAVDQLDRRQRAGAAYLRTTHRRQIGNVDAKFELPSFTDSKDTTRSLKFKKICHVTVATPRVMGSVSFLLHCSRKVSHPTSDSRPISVSLILCKFAEKLIVKH